MSVYFLSVQVQAVLHSSSEKEGLDLSTLLKSPHMLVSAIHTPSPATSFSNKNYPSLWMSVLKSKPDRYSSMHGITWHWLMAMEIIFQTHDVGILFLAL